MNKIVNIDRSLISKLSANFERKLLLTYHCVYINNEILSLYLWIVLNFTFSVINP